MLKQRNILCICVVVGSMFCAGKQLKRQATMELQDYKQLSWEKKISFFETLDAVKKGLPSEDIYSNAFRDSTPSIVIASIKSIPDSLAGDYKAQLYLLLKNKNPVIRWNACQKISGFPLPEDLRFLSLLFSDEDWMVRECAFHHVRFHPEEKNKKTYFFVILSELDDKNPQVLKEIYQTLKWYEDERTFTFLYKRLFHVQGPSELIIIMREISVYKNPLVRQRITYLSKYHQDFFVREEANRLLNSMN